LKYFAYYDKIFIVLVVLFVPISQSEQHGEAKISATEELALTTEQDK